jgi:hypothetical protein
MKDQRSRFYHRRNPPHSDRGHFASGRTLYTRYDGSSRWLRHFGPPLSEREQMLWLGEQARRVLRDIIVIVIAALLIIFVR